MLWARDTAAIPNQLNITLETSFLQTKHKQELSKTDKHMNHTAVL